MRNLTSSPKALRTAFATLGLLALVHTANASDWTPLLGGGAGAAAGAAIGQSMGGKQGAVVGGALGGAAGAAVTTKGSGQSGAVIGSAVGGAAGAAVGHSVGGSSGAVVGAGVGGAAGAGLGRSVTQRQPARAYGPGPHYEHASYYRDDFRPGKRKGHHRHHGHGLHDD